MGKVQQAWARKTRDRLMEELGGECTECGTTEKLEFDCIVAQGDKHHKMEFSWRMSFYRKQHAEGNLQILCQSCNATKGNLEKAAKHADEVPF